MAGASAAAPPHDRRAHIVQLTDEGASPFEQVGLGLYRKQQANLAVLSEAEQASMLEMMSRLTQHLSAGGQLAADVCNGARADIAAIPLAILRASFSSSASRSAGNSFARFGLKGPSRHDAVSVYAPRSSRLERTEYA